MPTASRQVRKLRRLKRELTLAYRGMDLALKQRDQTRLIAGALETELKKYIGDPFPEGEDKTEIKPACKELAHCKRQLERQADDSAAYLSVACTCDNKPSFKVTTLPDEEPIKDMINEGGPTHE